ncbi:MAG: PEP-CTERM sorting domain-containing protein [Bryobacteraceae bacterium]|nr:PEP-CTERM sorting domain-containing protein [Bryobacteraceae bacterium]
MYLHRYTVVALIVLTLVASTGLKAGPILNGDITIIDPPASVLEGGLTSDTTAFLIKEALRYRVNDPVLAGLWNVAVGTMVDVWMLHTDPVAPSVHFSGTIEFARPILHLDTTLAAMKASDPFMQILTGTLYEQDRVERGLGPVDHTSFGGNTLSYNWVTQVVVDQARIVTEAETPEPLTMGLTGLGCGAIGLMLRRRKARQQA